MRTEVDSYHLPDDIDASVTEHTCRIYENQRYLWLTGWGIDFYPDDPPPFTYAHSHNNECATFDNLQALSCPIGWKWLTSWEIDTQYTNTNTQGWSYSTTFMRLELKLQNQISSSLPTPRHVTRRRLWKRILKRDQKEQTSIQKLENKYRLTTEELGSGSYAVVRLGYSLETNVKYAIKCVNLLSSTLTDTTSTSGISALEQDLQNEIRILQSLDHPHITKLYDVYHDYHPHPPVRNMMYLVLEYITGGELFDRIISKTCYTEEEARDTTHILITTIAYLHSQNIVHRDLKPENLLMLNPNDDSAITITDFGFAIDCHGQAELSDFCGSPAYIAPEILKGELYGYGVDLWAIGVIVYILLSGVMPFGGETEEEQFDAIKRGDMEYPPETWGTISKEAKSFVSSLLTVDPSKRSDAESALSHPWVDPPICLLLLTSLCS
jgi:calcium/calmodulin-dependent protein kinase I